MFREVLREKALEIFAVKISSEKISNFWNQLSDAEHTVLSLKIVVTDWY